MPHDPARAQAELFARLRADLDDEATWSVLGDLLASSGDVRGELIALDQQRASLAGNDARRREHDVLAHRIAELAERHRAAWLGPLATASNLEVSAWKRGFVLAATVHGRPAGSRSSPGIVATLEQLVQGRAPLLRALVIPRPSSCTKAARLLARAAAEQHTIVESLSLPQARCERFAALAELEQLRTLSLGATQVPDLAALGGLPRLATLDLSRSRFDMTALGHGFAALRALDLRGHPLDAPQLDALRHLHALRELDVSEAPWSELAPLGHLRELERLHLRSTDAFDLRPLAGLAKLTFLDLRGSPVSDLEPLAGLEIEELRIGHTRVRDLRPLRTLRKLAVLELSGTPVADLGPLLELPSLAKVDIKGSEVADIQPLLARGVQVIGRPQARARTWRDLADELLRG